MKRPSKIPAVFFVAALAVCIAGFAAVMISAHAEANSYADLQLGAATRMQNAEKYIKERIKSLGISLEAEDLNQTYLIGPEFTELTTTPGSIDAKRSSLNPDFAALMIRYFHQAGLKKGDTIAVGTSGSFPGFVIAVTTAASEMGLHAKVIASCGASMHGGTRIDFNVFDFLQALKDGGFADFELLAVSPGSLNDQGVGCLEDILYTGTRETALGLCRETGVEVIDYPDLASSIKRRLELYGDDIDLFVNIGGASPNCGTSSYTLDFPQGLVLDPPRIPTTEDRGLNYEFAAEGIPVINLLNVRLLAQENGIAYDPVPLPSPGTGGVYASVEYSIPLIVITIVLVLAILACGWLQGRRKEVL